MKIVAASLLIAILGSANAFSPAFDTVGRSRKALTNLDATRKPFITGNWKLNPSTLPEALNLGESIAAAVDSGSPCDVALFVPYVFIEAVKGVTDGKISIGAEVSEDKASFVWLLFCDFLLQFSELIFNRRLHCSL
mmetsp:Transcript_33620/g.77577  ORF Transcript_33620/g.77577 Transcript_33620/m.77577 type:complete len:136 (+) Transcript_33620:114-521(+)